MEDNIYELSKAWKQLDESFHRVDEKKSKKGLSKNDHQSATKGRATQTHGPTKFKPAPRQKKVELDENGAACGATVAGGGNIAPFKAKLGKKPCKPGQPCNENFDIASLGAAPEVPEVPELGMGMDAGAEVEAPVSDIIAGLQARYPGAIIEISVTAPDGHRFSDTDISCATEVANASETPEELGGAWAKTEVEGEEGAEEGEESDEGTKPLAEAYPPSFGKKDDGAEEGAEEETEEPEEGGEEKEETEDKPSFGGEKEEGGEEGGEEGEGDFESCAGISQDCITLSPEGWNDFLAQVDQQPMGGEEGGEEGGEIEGAEMGAEMGGEEEVDEGMSDPGMGGSGNNHRELQAIKKKAAATAPAPAPAPVKKPLPPKV